MQNLNLPAIWPVACHTDQIGPSSTFVAIQGQASNGLEFVLLALQKGASKIVVDQLFVTPELQELVASFGAQLILVSNPRKALSDLSAQAWGYPAKKLKLIGITGTKGKTTSVYALRQILAQSGKQVAMLTGVENMIGNQKWSAQLTTPQPDFLHMFLAQCVQAGIEYVVMEASAQALSLNRLDDLLFTSIIFTNLELEHSEFYPNIETYFLAKCQLFNLLKPKACVVLNCDDLWVQKILANQASFFKKDLGLKIMKFGNNLNQQFLPDFYLDLLNSDLSFGLKFNLIKQDKAQFKIDAQKAFGAYNSYNLAGTVLCAQELGLAREQIEQALRNFTGAPGRLEIYTLPNGARGVVDYAHTPGSFKNVLQLLRVQTNHLIIIFGAGGGRDPIKRPVMGQIAQQFCDIVILTNDNPRQEEPGSIIKQIIGIQDPRNFLLELDRAQAIQLAYNLSKPESIIVLLGKGPDEYQIIGTQKFFFSDRQALLNL